MTLKETEQKSSVMSS